MNLENCTLDNMPQITIEQRPAVAHRGGEITIEQGFQKLFGVMPRNIIGDNLKCRMTVDDISVARITNGFHTSSGARNSFYAVSPGTTAFHIFTPDETEVISGTITVTESTPYDPPLGAGEFTGNHYNSFYYDTITVALQNETLYRFDGSQAIVCEENVKAYATGYRILPNRVYQYFDVVAKTDGTLLLNGKVISDIVCADIQNECVITENGELYGIYPDGKSLALIKIADDFKAFSYTARDFYINKDSEVIGYYVGYDENEKPYVKNVPTGIRNPISMYYNLFVDEDHVLWHPAMKYGELSHSKTAENVAEVGYYPINAFYSQEYLYQSVDGSWHPIYKEGDFTPVPNNPAKYGLLKRDALYIYQYKDEEKGISGYINWFLTEDNTLTLDNHGEHTSITNVACVIDSEYDKELNVGYAYFYRTDGSMWRYCFETKKYDEVIPAETRQTVKGDINADGTFNVSDVVLLQKWLLAVPNTPLADWKAGNFCEDDRLDVFDLCLMKRELLNSANDQNG